MSGHKMDRKKGKKEVWNRDPKYKPSYYGKAKSLVPPTSIKQTLLHANMTEERLLDGRRDLIQQQREWSFKLLRLQQKAFIIRQLLQQEMLRVKGIKATLLLPEIVIQAHKHIADTELRKVNYMGAKHLPMHGRMNVYELQKYKEDLLVAKQGGEDDDKEEPKGSSTKEGKDHKTKAQGKTMKTSGGRDVRASNSMVRSGRSVRVGGQYKSSSEPELILPYLQTPMQHHLYTPQAYYTSEDTCLDLPQDDLGLRQPTRESDQQLVAKGQHSHDDRQETSQPSPIPQMLQNSTYPSTPKTQLQSSELQPLVVISPPTKSTHNVPLSPDKDNRKGHKQSTNSDDRAVAITQPQQQGGTIRLGVRPATRHLQKHVTISEYPSSSSKKKVKPLTRQSTLSDQTTDRRFVDLHSSLTLSPQGSHDGFSMLSPASWGHDDQMTAEDREIIKLKYLSLSKHRLDPKKIHSALHAVQNKTRESNES